MKRTPSLILALLTFSTLQAADPGSAQPFRNGDIVDWVGDSITHGGTYPAMVELFYATRFPDRKIRYYNDGISGDRASAIMSDEKYRLNVDILAHKPTVATIMLGMNDINRGDYAADKTSPEDQQKHQHFIDIYDENMHKLMDALTKAGSKLILIQPSIFDQTTTLAGAGLNTFGSNDALGKCSLLLHQWAIDYHAGIVNFFGEMNEINQREQAKDPAFTLVGKDRIHPGPVGHFVMAYTFLMAQGLPSQVAVIGVNAKKAKAGETISASVRNVAKTPVGVEFDALEKSLPFVVPENAKPALALVPFMNDLNRETLMVADLKKGTYSLKIDKQEIGEYTAAQLAAGIDLAANAKTPQYQQSAGATQINADRTKVGAAIRDMVAQKYGLSRGKLDVLDNAVLEKRMREMIATAETQKKAVNKAWTAVLDDIATPGKLMGQYDQLADDLLKACQPKEHHYSLVRMP